MDRAAPDDFTDSLPNGGTFSPANRTVLSRYWHAVAFAEELSERPLGVTLLDVPLVIYRSGGRVAAALDRCPHRGARLSRGRLADDQLVCPYHGLHFDGDGRCTRIPASPEGKISERLRLKSLACRETHNLIWVCFAEEAEAPLPGWEELHDEGFQTFALPAFHCGAAASRYCENFNDVVHFSWVHQGTFGLSGSTRFTPYEVTEQAHGLEHEIVYRQIDRDTFEDGADAVTDSYYRYRFTLPFANHMHIDFGGGRNQHIFSVASPVSASSCRVFVQVARDYDKDEPVEEAIRFEQSVAAEDLAVIEHIVPAPAPLDLKKEFHISGDRWSIVYRQRLAGLGLTD